MQRKCYVVIREQVCGGSFEDYEIVGVYVEQVDAIRRRDKEQSERPGSSGVENIFSVVERDLL